MKTLTLLIRFFSIASLLLSTVLASAGEWNHATRFGIGTDPRELTLNEPKLTLQSKGEVYYVEAVAVVDAPAERVFRASLAYDHYKEFAPYVRDSRIIETIGGDEQTLPSDIFIWTRMLYKGSYLGIKKTMDSKYYLHIQPNRGVLRPDDYAIRWALAEPQPGWKFPTEPYFRILDGSWYIVPLDAGTAYLRYFIKIQTDTWVPNWIVRSVLKDSLGSGVRDLVLAIKERAKK